MTTLLLVLAICLTPPAQAIAPNPAKEAMARLRFLEGVWEGEGSISTGPGQRKQAAIREEVVPRLGGTVFVIEGLGHAIVDGKKTDQIVHEALGVISYDSAAKKYRIRTFRASGEMMDPEIEVGDRAIVWSFKSPQGMNVRFSISVDAAGAWVEKGEVSPAGDRWIPFFEMTLKKVLRTGTR